MFRKNLDTLLIAIIFVIVATLLNKFNFWGAIGLEIPHGLVAHGLMFLALVVVMQHIFFEPYMSIADERFEQTTGRRKRSEENKLKANEMLKSYEQRILDARMDAIKQREHITLEAENEERKQLETAKAKAQKELEAALAQMETQVEKVRSDLSQSTQALVTQLVEKTLSQGSFTPTGSSSSNNTKNAETRM